MRVPIFCNDYVLLRIYGCGGVFYDIQTRQALSRLLNKSTSVAYNFVITKKNIFPVSCVASLPVFNPMFPCAASVPVFNPTYVSLCSVCARV